MSNPSTVWTQLSLPNPPTGSIPFVFTDQASIVTDVVNFFYSQTGAQLSGSIAPNQLTVFGGLRVGYLDQSATPGNVTINKSAGRAAFAAGTNSVVVTSAYAFLGSIVLCILETADATLTRMIAVAAAGSVTFTGNANATGVTKFSFVIINVF